MGMSKTSRLEELRKEGGDKWLSILNAEKQKVHIDPTHYLYHTHYSYSNSQPRKCLYVP